MIDKTLDHILESTYDRVIDPSDAHEQIMRLFSWRSVDEETPPSNIELLAKAPNGTIHLTHWRLGYNIFTCQSVFTFLGIYFIVT